MDINIIQYLTFSIILFLIGIWGLVLNNKNIIIMFMAIEIMLLAVNFNFIIFSIYLDDIIGQIFALYILTVAASEAAIGLAILMIHFRLTNEISIHKIISLKG
jgi:NADH-quinone oxidoreductase subunit K